MFDANLFGIMNMCQTFLPQLLAAKGSIINMGSVAAHMPLPFFSNYAASKAALHAYSECMRVELAPLGVAVTYVMAGNVRTNELSTTRYQLDSSSLWYPVNDNFEKELHKAMTTGMEPADFAKRLADQTIERRRDTVWVGAGAVGCWFISALENWLPFRIWPTLFSVMYGMKRVGVHRQ
jgi:1-acylglycerone phosphate reductase